MKPHIKPEGKSAWIGMWVYCPGWSCSGDGHAGWGVSPRHAYAAWVAQSFNQQMLMPGTIDNEGNRVDPFPTERWWHRLGRSLFNA